MCEVRDIMWNGVGLVRSGGGLKHALRRLQDLGAGLGAATTRRGCEARNMHLAGLLDHALGIGPGRAPRRSLPHRLSRYRR